jgi:hypothetical protein
MNESFLAGLVIGFLLGLISEVLVGYFRSRDDDEDED